MSTYAGATFECATGDSRGFRPDWARELALTVTHIPGSDTDDIQSGGLQNARITIPAIIESDADYALLKAAVGITPRTLGDYYETNYTSVILVSIKSARRLAWDAKWVAELEFMQVSS